MSSDDELYEATLEYFKSNEFLLAEPLLNQLILRGSKKPDVFYMLGSIFYDQGKFKKAIRSFKRALQIDASFTDASVGLSIILNDLGQYEEGQEVFNSAQVQLKAKNKKDDDYINERIALKHQELGELYFRYERFSESLEQYLKSYQIFKKKAQPLYGASDCFLKMGHVDKAVMLFKNIIKKYPKDLTAHLKLAQTYFELGNIMHAIEICESVLEIDPKNSQAKMLLKKAQPEEQLEIKNKREVHNEATFE
jgi:tetratricopeptide (TPR) repeat protein